MSDNSHSWTAGIRLVRAYLVPAVPRPFHVVKATLVAGLVVVGLTLIDDPSYSRVADWGLGDGNRWPTPNELGAAFNALTPTVLTAATALTSVLIVLAIVRTAKCLAPWRRAGLGAVRYLDEEGSGSVVPRLKQSDARGALNPAGRVEGALRVATDWQLREAGMMLVLVAGMASGGVGSKALLDLLLASTLPVLVSRGMVVVVLLHRQKAPGRRRPAGATSKGLA